MLGRDSHGQSSAAGSDPRRQALLSHGAPSAPFGSGRAEGASSLEGRRLEQVKLLTSNLAGQLTAPNLRKLFRLMDTDNDAKLGHVELQRGLLAMGFREAGNPAVIGRLLQELDVDHSGWVTEDEFLQFFQKLQLQSLQSRLQAYSGSAGVASAAGVTGGSAASGSGGTAGVSIDAVVFSMKGLDGSQKLCARKRVPPERLADFIQQHALSDAAASRDHHMWLDVVGFNDEVLSILATLTGVHKETLTDAFVFQTQKVEVLPALETMHTPAPPSVVAVPLHDPSAPMAPLMSPAPDASPLRGGTAVAAGRGASPPVAAVAAGQAAGLGSAASPVTGTAAQPLTAASPPPLAAVPLEAPLSAGAGDRGSVSSRSPRAAPARASPATEGVAPIAAGLAAVDEEGVDESGGDTPPEQPRRNSVRLHILAHAMSLVNSGLVDGSLSTRAMRRLRCVLFCQWLGCDLRRAITAGYCCSPDYRVYEAAVRRRALDSARTLARSFYTSVGGVSGVSLHTANSLDSAGATTRPYHTSGEGLHAGHIVGAGASTGGGISLLSQGTLAPSHMLSDASSVASPAARADDGGGDAGGPPKAHGAVTRQSSIWKADDAGSVTLEENWAGPPSKSACCSLPCGSRGAAAGPGAGGGAAQFAPAPQMLASKEHLQRRPPDLLVEQFSLLVVNDRLMITLRPATPAASGTGGRGAAGPGSPAGRRGGAGASGNGETVLGILFEGMKQRLRTYGEHSIRLYTSSVRTLAMDVVDATLQYSAGVRDDLTEWHAQLEHDILHHAAPLHSLHLYSLRKMCELYLRQMEPVYEAFQSSQLEAPVAAMHPGGDGAGARMKRRMSMSVIGGHAMAHRMMGSDSPRERPSSPAARSARSSVMGGAGYKHTQLAGAGLGLSTVGLAEFFAEDAAMLREISDDVGHLMGDVKQMRVRVAGGKLRVRNLCANSSYISSQGRGDVAWVAAAPATWPLCRTPRGMHRLFA
jgi:hypothetical protein